MVIVDGTPNRGSTAHCRGSAQNASDA